MSPIALDRFGPQTSDAVRGEFLLPIKAGASPNAAPAPAPDDLQRRGESRRVTRFADEGRSPRSRERCSWRSSEAGL
jgi:hypothetical protein